MRAAYGEALLELGASNPRVVVLGADTTDSIRSAVFGNKYPERFVNVGIAEQNLVGVAAGLALAGKIPYAGTYAIFVPGKCVDQIRNMIAYAYLDVKLVCSHGGISVGPDGASHQQVEDIATIRAIPKMRLEVPADAVLDQGHREGRGRHTRAVLHPALKGPGGGELCRWSTRTASTTRWARGTSSGTARTSSIFACGLDGARGDEGLRLAQGQGRRRGRDRPPLGEAHRRGPDSRSTPGTAATPSPPRSTASTAGSARPSRGAGGDLPYSRQEDRDDGQLRRERRGARALREVRSDRVPHRGGRRPLRTSAGRPRIKRLK